MGSSLMTWPRLRGAFFLPLDRKRAVRLQHLASEIKRAGDQYARRRIEREARDRRERRLQVALALGWDADGARDVDDGVGSQAFRLIGDRHGDDAAGEPGEILEK